MDHNDDPPWLRAARPVLVLSPSADDKGSGTPPTISDKPASEIEAPTAPFPPRHSSAIESTPTMLPTPPDIPVSAPNLDDDQYIGWKPQQMPTQQMARTPPPSLSPLDLTMYPGAPVQNDPAAARKAIAGLRPLRILSSRPRGPASAGPSRPPSVEGAISSASATAARSGFASFFSAAKRVSAIAIAVSG